MGIEHVLTLSHRFLPAMNASRWTVSEDWST
jgi:hypothetical protein